MQKFIHISFDKNLEGVWKPQLPANDGVKVKTDLSEPDILRICVAPTVADCFRAIYPNVSKYFEKENYPYMLFQVYSPVINDGVKLINWEELQSKKYVHDAHITREAWILSQVKMNWIAEIKIENTNLPDNELLYRPFNDVKNKLIFHSPKNVKFTTIKSKPGISLESIPLYINW